MSDCATLSKAVYSLCSNPASLGGQPCQTAIQRARNAGCISGGKRKTKRSKKQSKRKHRKTRRH